MRNQSTRRTTRCVVIIIFVACLTVCAATSDTSFAQRRPARAADAYASGDAAKLSAAHVRRLLSLRTAIAIPTYIPRGFRVAEVTARRDTKTTRNFAIIDYAIRYAGPRGQSFSINSANEGIGDLFLSAERMLKGTNPYFEHPVEVGYMDDDSDGVAEQELASQWISSRRAYRLRKTPDAEQVYHLRAEGITLRDALRIMESLRYLKQ